jgi:hypothetical protein
MRTASFFAIQMANTAVLPSWRVSFDQKQTAYKALN